MITGLKIATGFSQSSSNYTSHGPNSKVGADAAALTGVLLEAGPELVENTRTVSHGRARN